MYFDCSRVWNTILFMLTIEFICQDTRYVLGKQTNLGKQAEAGQAHAASVI